MHTRTPEYLLNEAAGILAEVRSHVWDGRSLPVPIEAIAENHFGLLIREVADIATELPELSGELGGEEVISGALIPERAEIWVDATEASRWPQRRRYTIAHEIGHWVLHRGPDTAFCREAAVRPTETVVSEQRPTANDYAWDANPGQPGIEWEANVFGGALLLPPWLVRKVWDRGHSIEELAEVFDVSLSAVNPRWRLHYSFLGTSY